MQFTFVYPPNEPYSCCEGPALELAGQGCLPVISQPGSFTEVYAICHRANRPVVFWGGLTQLSWLFETPEMRALWKVLPNARYMIATENCYTAPMGDASFPERRDKALEVSTHLGTIPDNWELPSLRATGKPVHVFEFFPTALKGYQNRVPFAERQRRVLFIGTRHGIVRKALMGALEQEGLLHSMQIPLVQWRRSVDLHNTYAVVANFRSYQDRQLRYLPRVLESWACGNYLLDFSDLEADQGALAVARVLGIDWEQAERLAALGHLEVERFAPEKFYQAVTHWCATQL